MSRSGQVERTISSGHEAIRFPRVSPDGKRVMLSEQKDGNYDVWVEDIESGARVRLTTGPEPDSAGAWSASGERVAIMSGLMSDSGVVLMRADGSGQTERLPFRSNPLPEAIAVSPDWSPDGRFVIFRSGGDLFYGDVSEKRPPASSRSRPSPRRRAGSHPTGGSWLTRRTSRGGSRSTCARSPRATGSGWSRRTGARRPGGAGRGNELFFFEGNALMAAPVSTRDGFRAIASEETLRRGRHRRP